MDSSFKHWDIKEVIAKRMFPTFLMWNRLEARPRNHDFDKALKAEVRDALWMLTKQWQMGEFNGEDAGSPILAKVAVQSSMPTDYKAPNKAEFNLDNNTSIEALVEQRKIPFKRYQQDISIDIRLQIGRYWMKLLDYNNLNYGTEYIQEYPFILTLRERDNSKYHAHQEVIQEKMLIAGRNMNGYALIEKLLKAEAASTNITSNAADIILLDNLGIDLLSWFNKTYHQLNIEENNAWLPERLEYQFDLISRTDKEKIELKAEEYYSGELDWYNYNIQRSSKVGGDAPLTITDSLIPTHLKFQGMPDNRWWKFEDSKTSFGDIQPSTTDISKLILIEFGLVMANDWFLIPFTLPVNSLSKVTGLTVTNSFGESFWIEPAELPNNLIPEWSMFKMQSDKYDDTMYLAPAVLKIQESEPLEEIMMIKDEMANMVWGIEKYISNALGDKVNGDEYALQTRAFHESFISPNALPLIQYAANISYQAMTTVPENWIPFIPIHRPGSKRQTQLQRGSMLRVIEGDTETPKKIKPQTTILSEGLESKPNALPYYIHQEEVPRSGIRVSQSFQRTRLNNGEVVIWLGMKKKIGRGEGSSGLAFDQIKHVKKDEGV